MSVVIAQVKKGNDADFVARIIKNIHGKVNVIREEDWEDYMLEWMGEASEQEGGEVPRKKISNFLKKHGIDF